MLWQNTTDWETEKFILAVLETEKSKSKVLAYPVSGAVTILVLQFSVFLLYPHMVESREGERKGEREMGLISLCGRLLLLLFYLFLLLLFNFTFK